MTTNTSSTKRMILRAAAASVAIFSPLFSRNLVHAVQTTWTNATGNNLWGTPGNWTNGVPTGSDAVSFLAGRHDVIDLGGVNRSAIGLNLLDSYTLTNGTLTLTNITSLSGVS